MTPQGVYSEGISPLSFDKMPYGITTNTRKKTRLGVFGKSGLLVALFPNRMMIECYWHYPSASLIYFNPGTSHSLVLFD
jgi:hypothetical protein